jgi:hypothetical protein
MSFSNLFHSRGRQAFELKKRFLMCEIVIYEPSATRRFLRTSALFEARSFVARASFAHRSLYNIF